MGRTTVRVVSAGALAVAAVGGAFLLTPHDAKAQGGAIGVNVLLRSVPSDAVLADLALHGAVLDVIPEVNAVMLRTDAAELPAIQALPYVAAANPDRERFLSGSGDPISVSDFSGGANIWNLDMIDVTDVGAGRTVAYDGAGVCVAVIDTGLTFNWRAYLPEARIDAVHARCFGGGGGENGTVSEQPNGWEHADDPHGLTVTSVILGFDRVGSPTNGVAPKATVIPIRVRHHSGIAWSSEFTRALLYATQLKVGGALGGAPLVVNMSFGGPSPDAIERAAIDYAIAHGVVVVAVAHNQGAIGMMYPGAYAPVISVANAGWVGEFPADDPTHLAWMGRDVPEGDASQFLIAPDSGRELPGQDLDVAAPGLAIAVPWSENGQVDHAFSGGTSLACPHVAGVAALMLQKNPGLTQAQIESILESTALPLPPGSVSVTAAGVGNGPYPTFSRFENIYFFGVTVTWGADATGHGLVQADAALAATQ